MSKLLLMLTVIIIIITETITHTILNTKGQFNLELECAPMPNLMVALPNIGGAVSSTPQSLADAHY